MELAKLGSSSDEVQDAVQIKLQTQTLTNPQTVAFHCKVVDKWWSGGKYITSTTREPADVAQCCSSFERISCPSTSLESAMRSFTWASMPPAPRRMRRSGIVLLCQEGPTALGEVPHATQKSEVTAVMTKRQLSMATGKYSFPLTSAGVFQPDYLGCKKCL